MALLAAVLLGLPAGVLAGSTRLVDASVSPRSGTTATLFTFGVTYQNKEGSGGPNEITVVIDGVAHGMRGSGGDWRNGVRYTYATRLPTGTHTIVFHSRGRDRFVSDLDAGTVTVGAAPTPRPTPRPTPAPGGAGGGSSGGSASGGGSTSGGSSGSAGSGSSGSGATSGGSDGTSSGSSGGASGGAGDPVVTGSRGGPGDGGEPASGGFVVPTGSRGGPGAGGTPASGGDATTSGGNARAPESSSAGASNDNARGATTPAGAGWADLNVLLKTLSWGGGAAHSMPLLESIVFTAGTMTLLTAFLFFGKRRRDGEPPEPDEVLQASAARGAGHAATSTLVPNFPTPPGVSPEEAAMPRWRRPSLMQARKMDPTRATETAVPMTFAGGRVAAVDGYERRVIRYHVVRLLDAPDELRGVEIAVLSRDDEVQVIERNGTYCYVLCPDGTEGWIHKMTLGDTVSESAASRQAFSATSDYDDDVLTAFIAARGRA